MCMALEIKSVSRAAKVSVVVGSILVFINQGDDIAQMRQPDWFKVLLTYLVPYCVSLWTSIVKDLEISSTHVVNRGINSHE